MDRIAIIVRHQWRAYWRRVRRGGNLNKSNLGALVLLGGVGVVRYFQQLPLTGNQLARGETQRYQTLLLLVFLAWMVPVMAESRRSIASRNLLHFPLSVRELFSIRLASVFVSPVSWIIAAGSLALVYPLSRSTSPVAGAAGLLLFVLLALFSSLMIAPAAPRRWTPASRAGAAIDLARTIVRRAERMAVRMAREGLLADETPLLAHGELDHRHLAREPHPQLGATQEVGGRGGAVGAHLPPPRRGRRRRVRLLNPPGSRASAGSISALLSVTIRRIVSCQPSGVVRRYEMRDIRPLSRAAPRASRCRARAGSWA